MRFSRLLAVLSLGLTGALLSTCGEREPEPGIAELTAALGRRRPVEPRLTGKFTYQACNAVAERGRLIPRTVCSSALPSDPKQLKAFRIASSRLRENATRGGDSEALRAGALASLIGPEKALAAAVESLEAASARDPKDAQVLSDLAAAWLVRAQEEDDPQALVRALDAAARAYAADPSLLEARFNLALSLDRLHLRILAASAWDEYRHLEEDAGWAGEAVRRSQALARPAIPDLWKDALPRLEAAVAQEDEAAVKRIVGIDPQAAREHAVEYRLGAWGDRFLAGDEAGALSHLRIAAAIGKALSFLNGDVTVESAVAAVERARSGALAALARGHQDFRAAVRKTREVASSSDPSPLFASAREHLRRGGSPIELWALWGVARGHGYHGRYSEAAAAYETVLARGESFPSLQGMAQWGLGWVRSREGYRSESMTRFQAAEAVFSRVQERENLGGVRGLLAGDLYLLGQNATAWRHRFQALSNLSGFPLAWRRHNVLMEGARAAAAEGLIEAAALLQEEDLKAAEESGNPTWLSEALWGRSRIFMVRGRAREAWEDGQKASQAVRPDPGNPQGAKLRADLQWVQGEALRLLDPRAALGPLSEAIESYRQLKAYHNLGAACLGRARLRLGLGQDTEGEADLGTALRVTEQPGSGIEDEDLLGSYADSVQDVYDEMIRFQWDRRGNARAALAVLERARNFRARQEGALLPDLGAEDRLAAALAGIPKNIVILEYALLDERLLIWSLVDGRLGITERQVGRREVERLVEGFLRKVQRRAEPSKIQKSSTGLYDLLIPPAARELNGEEVFFFVPDRILHKVPFAALQNPDDKSFLIQDHPVAVSPSLAHLLRPGSKKPTQAPSSMLLVGAPAFDRSLFNDLADLPEARAEAEEASSLFPGASLLLGKDATKSRLLAELDRFEIFAFAGHAVSNANRPSQSYLLLAPDARDSGLLLGQELSRRRLKNLRLVVLSACSTMGPRASRSSGVAGLARPFLDAGAQTVVGSLWNVDDRGTRRMLPIFYRLLARGQPAIHALRQAQLEALGNSEEELRDAATWSALAVVDTI